MSFSRTPSGAAAKYLFIYLRNHTDDSSPSNPTRFAAKKEASKLDWIGGLKEYREQYTALENYRKKH